MIWPCANCVHFVPESRSRDKAGQCGYPKPDFPEPTWVKVQRHAIYFSTDRRGNHFDFRFRTGLGGKVHSVFIESCQFQEPKL